MGRGIGQARRSLRNGSTAISTPPRGGCVSAAIPTGSAAGLLGAAGATPTSGLRTDGEHREPSQERGQPRGRAVRIHLRPVSTGIGVQPQPAQWPPHPCVGVRVPRRSGLPLRRGVQFASRAAPARAAMGFADGPRARSDQPCPKAVHAGSGEGIAHLVARYQQ